MNRLIKICSAFVLLAFSQCQDECVKNSRCDLDPEVGPCDAVFVRYYYDREEKKCKSFEWGGCDGVVPFETLEECKNDCGCD